MTTEKIDGHQQIQAGTITDTEVATANKDGITSLASLRTLGSGAQQAAAGNHSHGGGSVSDGDYGDITVTGSGATWTIDPNAVTLSKLATQASDTILANITGGAAVPTAVSLAANTFLAKSSAGNIAAKTITDFALTILDDADAATVRATIGAGTGSGTVGGTGVVGQLAEWVTNTSTLQAAKIIGPAVNILTITNAAAATLALNITAAKTLTLTSPDDFTLTIPASLTAAGLSIQNVFTVNQFVDGSANVIQLRVQAHSTQTQNLLTFEKSDGTVYGGVDNLGRYINNLGGDVSNLFIGQAGKTGLTNTNNVGIGKTALAAITSGQSNFGLGAESLLALTTGTDNVAIGAYSGSQTNGSGNVFIGSSTGQLGTGSGNIFIGFGAGLGVTGQTRTRNVAIGYAAGASIRTGGTNVFIGDNSGNQVTTGSNNIYIGEGSGYNQTTISNVFIIDNAFRASAAAEIENSFLYGSMAAGGYLATNIGTTTTNAVKEILRLQAYVSTASTGAANGFGSALNLYAETATDLTYQQQAQIASVWVDATNSTRKADLVLSVFDTASREGIRIRADGTQSMVAIGGATASSRLTLPAGGTAASTAPLKFTTQVNPLTVVEQGAMELVGNSLQFTQKAKRRGVAMSQATITADTTTGNTTTESAAMITAEHGANYLEVGKCEEIILRGIVQQASDGGGQLQVRVKYAGTTKLTITTATGNIAAGTPFEIKVTTTLRTTGGTGTLQINAVLWIDGVVNIPDSTSLATVDTTTAQNTTITLQWTVADAGNTITVNQGRVLCIEPNK